MDVRNISPDEYVDIFNINKTQTAEPEGAFTAFNNDANIFTPQQTPEEVEAAKKAAEDAAAAAETKTPEQIEAAKKAEEEAAAAGDGGIFMHDEDKAKLGRKRKYDFTETSGYFADRIKNGKFVALEEEKDGQIVSFIPKTPEEFDEFYELQLNHQLEQKAKDLEQTWYSTKTPAWKAVAQYAEVVDDPKELIPFIQGVQNIQTIGGIDPKTIEGAEQIIRHKMALSGDTQEVIDEQVEALKTTNKLITAAERTKPILVAQETQRLQQMQAQKDQQERQYAIMVETNQRKAIEAIEAPLFGKQKLQREEKAIVYDLIGQPNPEQGGYAIYSAIDELFDKQDFQTLRDVALLLKNKDKFLSYAGQGVAAQTSANLQRTLRVAGQRSSGGDQDAIADNRQQQRQPQQRQPIESSFGRR